MKETDPYLQHLNREWDVAGWPKDGDDMQARIYRNIRDLLEIFSEENHSGTSAPYTINLFKRIAAFEPILPLTGEADEWEEVGSGVYQNKRCSHVFKESDGAYDSEGKVFVESDGGGYTSIDSRVKISFPYTPEREVVHV